MDGGTTAARILLPRLRRRRLTWLLPPPAAASPSRGGPWCRQHPSDLRGALANVSVPEKGIAFKFPAVSIVGNDSERLRMEFSLPEQRHIFGFNFDESCHINPRMNYYGRVIHTNLQQDYKYGVGRHSLPGAQNWPNTGFIMKFLWSPWPESLERKKQIGPRIPFKDIQQRAGVQHTELNGKNKSYIQLHRQSFLRKLVFGDLNQIDSSNGQLFMVAKTYHQTFIPSYPKYNISAT